MLSVSFMFFCVLAVNIERLAAEDLNNYFLAPPTEEVWFLGSSVNIIWVANHSNYQVSFWQQNSTDASANLIRIVYPPPGGTATIRGVFNWDVSTYDAIDVTNSPEFFFWIDHDGGYNATSPFVTIVASETSATSTSISPSSTTSSSDIAAPSPTTGVGTSATYSFANTTVVTSSSSSGIVPASSSIPEIINSAPTNPNPNPTSGSLNPTSDKSTPTSSSSVPIPNAGTSSVNTKAVLLGVTCGVGLPLMIVAATSIALLWRKRRLSLRSTGSGASLAMDKGDYDLPAYSHLSVEPKAAGAQLHAESFTLTDIHEMDSHRPIQELE